MHKVIFTLVILAVALSACASPAGPSASPTGLSPAKDNLATATAIVAPDIHADFTPTDPATVNLAAGKPQLVEFFAFW
jgi:hypothetical protein